MKKTLLKQGYKVLEDAFIASFLMLVASAFLEFFYPGIIAYYANTAWLFGLVLVLGAAYLMVQSIFGQEFEEKPSRARLILARAAYILCLVVLLIIIIKLFAGILFLQIVIGLALIILGALVYSEFLC